MNYRVILNEQTTIYLSNIDIVRVEDETVIFRELEGNVVAAFKLYNITGFFREDGPPIAPKHEWDFDLIDKYTKKQQEEVFKSRAYSPQDIKYKDLVSYAQDR